MLTSIRRAVLAGITMTAAVGAQTQSGSPPAAPPALPPAPAVGEAAPDFTAPAADMNGVLAKPVTLSQLKGKVVVLAFYPLDRSSGCTAELSKFRDEYATLFGDGVVVLPVSVDTIESHAGWAKDAKFPFALVADPKGEIAVKYGSQGRGRTFSRTVFVIGKDGKVAYAARPFGALAQDGYDKLAAAIKVAKG
jgi:thioredoxin-dependent peroxiredoxin